MSPCKASLGGVADNVDNPQPTNNFALQLQAPPPYNRCTTAMDHQSGPVESIELSDMEPGRPLRTAPLAPGPVTTTHYYTNYGGCYYLPPPIVVASVAFGAFGMGWFVYAFRVSLASYILPDCATLP
ncbi:uncharacterized protein BP5553_00190 [Venustampulla echinocandica]|uniref:Transmembrane protein n=1 Tax=Venustampulla echinocandica TaxID=2656787 RepID=A0A370TXF1_9HELO|nr:uncharacterized protein BP5553_00190 [Venustampulla echinocandica]RDL40211.1 hypothetical protein BP5553_00190 [Venustampulla echinocandica]